MQKNRTLYIFDLDNTLIDENHFILSRLNLFLDSEIEENSLKKEISYFFETNFPQKRRKIIQLINQKFKTKLDIDLYKYYLRDIKFENSLKTVNNCIERLEELNSLDKYIWICTNGNSKQQSSKIRELQKSFSFELKVLYCENIKPKPSPKPVRHILRISHISRSQSVFIGDSWTDRFAANAAGVKFIRADVFFKM